MDSHGFVSAPALWAKSNTLLLMALTASCVRSSELMNAPRRGTAGKDGNGRKWPVALRCVGGGGSVGGINGGADGTGGVGGGLGGGGDGGGGDGGGSWLFCVHP